MSGESSIKIEGTGPIVLVEDEPVDVEIFEFAFRKAELTREKKCFLSGEAFLEYLERVKAAKETPPAVVLLDINLGTTSGLEILDKMRSDASLSAQPVVIMLSSSEQERDITRAKALGCDGYQVKFTSPMSYIHFLKSLFELDS